MKTWFACLFMFYSNMIFVVLEESGMKSEVRFVYKSLMEQISYT